MKIDIENLSADKNRITFYTTGWIRVNQEIVRSNCIISAHSLVSDWRPDSLSDLTVDDFNIILDEQPEIILLGTGTRMRFPQPEITNFIHRHNIGFEVMDTGAAIRSYNVLISEGRTVFAALFMLD